MVEIIESVQESIRYITPRCCQTVRVNLTLIANLSKVNVTSRRWLISDSMPRMMPLLRRIDSG
jgi:hypothetical protein